MKNKGKINPRDVPKTKFISEKKDIVVRNNESFRDIESSSDFSKEEFEEDKKTFKRNESKKRQDNRNINYENSQDYVSYSQENIQDLFNTGVKSNKEKRQRKTQERIFEETLSQGDLHSEYSISDYKKSDMKEENRYNENYGQEEITKETRYGQETDYKLSNFEGNFNHRPNFTSPKLLNRSISKNNCRENKDTDWKEEVKRDSFQDRTEKEIRGFKKEEASNFYREESPSYDPLSQDSDNDGVIDRYDINFRDSNVSYRDTRDDHKYLSTSKSQKKNWEGFSLLGNKGRENIQKNKLKILYQEESQVKDEKKKTGLKLLSEKFRKKSSSYKENEEDKKTIQNLSSNKKKNSNGIKDKATITEDKKTESDSSNGKFRKDSLSKRTKSEVKDNKDRLDKRRQETDTFDNFCKKSNFDPKEEYTRTKKEIKDPNKILEEKNTNEKKESKFHTKKDKKTEKDKFYKKEEKVSKLYEKKSKKEKDLIKDKKKAKKGGLEKPITLASAMTSNYLYSGKEDNTGINAAYKLSRTTEIAGRKISHNRRKKPLKTQRKIKSLEEKIYKKESKLLFQRNFEEIKKTKAYQNTNRLNRLFMKKRFQRDFKKKQGESIRKRIKNTFSSLGKKTVEVIRRKGYKRIIIVLCFLGLFIMGFQSMSGIGSISLGLTSNVMATSYLSKEEVLSDVNNEFSSYEYALQDEIDSIKTNYPNYDEYHIKGDSVGHDVHELFSYLTARYGEIKSVGEIQGELKKLFNQMYEKKYTSKSMTKYDSEGNPYTYRILTLTITRKSIDEVAKEEFSNYETNMAHYLALLENQGNMSGTFGSGYGDLGEIIDNPNFGNPGIEFDDATVKRLFGEAEKHIGKRYVFGASGPSNFDCSGFVCWSFSKSGVKRMPRTTAWLIYKNYCNPISPSEAKPGDIIFFKGTYNSGTPISHVGIYAGNGMMIHAGDPIQYTSINSKYWKSHFYSFGRPR